MTVNSRALRLGRRFTGAQVLTHKFSRTRFTRTRFTAIRLMRLISAVKEGLKKPCTPMEAWLSAFLRMLTGPHGSELSFCAGNVNLGAVG